MSGFAHIEEGKMITTIPPNSRMLRLVLTSAHTPLKESKESRSCVITPWQSCEISLCQQANPLQTHCQGSSLLRTSSLFCGFTDQNLQWTRRKSIRRSLIRNSAVGMSHVFGSLHPVCLFCTCCSLLAEDACFVALASDIQDWSACSSEFVLGWVQKLCRQYVSLPFCGRAPTCPPLSLMLGMPRRPQATLRVMWLS